MRIETYDKKFYEARAYGKFNLDNLKKSKNWFFGWLRYLNKFLDLKFGKGRKSLEIGCGFGAVSNLLSERGFEAYATDISQYAIREAKKLSPQIKFLKFDVQKKIPFDGKFDLIVAIEVLEHLPFPEKAIINIYKKLKKKGFFVCSTPFPYQRYLYSEKMLGHLNVKHPREWKSIFEKVGFKEKRLRIKPVFFLPFLYRFHRMLSLVLPFNFNLPFTNSTVFYIAQKNE